MIKYMVIAKDGDTIFDWEVAWNIERAKEWEKMMRGKFPLARVIIKKGSVSEQTPKYPDSPIPEYRNRRNARLEFEHTDIKSTATLYLPTSTWDYLVTKLGTNKLTVTLRFEGEK